MSTSNNTLIGGIVAVSLAVVLAISFMLPIISDAAKTEDTFNNEGYFYLDKYTDDYTLSWDYTTPEQFTINGETVEYDNNSGLAVSIVLGEKFAVRLATDNLIYFFGNGTYILGNSTYTSFSLTLSEGSLTATNGTNTKVIPDVDELYSIAETGDYVMKKSNATAYLNSGSELISDSGVYATGQTYNGGAYIFWHLEGTIDNMDYPDVYDSNLTISNQKINGAYSTSHNDLYELENIAFTATNTNNVQFNVTASYFVVPAEVTAERTVHFDSAEIALIEIIPILVIAGVILGVVGMAIRARLS